MSTVLGEMVVSYKADLSGLTSKVQEAKSEISSVSETAQKASESMKGMSSSAQEASGGFSGMVKNALSFAGGQMLYTGVANAIGFLKDQTLDAFHAASDHQQIMVQTAQALKSTRDASGETAQSLQDLAESFSKVTPFSEDSIQSAENLELTFTNISKSVMPQATQSILDVSQAMGQDLKSSTIQIGKALGDPITGMSALQRIGVTFSATEKEQVKTMMAHNDVIGAQKIILGELSTEFGGSATAAGKTFGGQMDILKNKLTDFKIKLASDLMPALQGLASLAMGGVSTAFTLVGTAIRYVKDVFQSLNLTDFKQLWQSIGDEIGSIAQHFRGLGGVLSEVGTDADPIANILGILMHGVLSGATAILSGVSSGLMTIDMSLQGMKTPLSEVAGLLGGAFKLGLDTLKGVWSAIGPGLQQAASILAGQFKADLAWLGSTFQQIAGWAESQLLPALAHLAPPIETVAGAVASNILPALAHLYAIGHQVAEAVLTPLIGLFEHILPPVISFGALLGGLLAGGFQRLSPLAGGLVNILGGLVTFFTKTELGGDLVKAVLIAMAIPVAALAIGFGILAVEAIAGFIASIPAMVGGFIAGAAGAWTMASGVMMLAFPILAVIAVIAGIILAIQHWGAIAAWLHNAWDTVTSGIGRFFAMIGGWVHTLGQVFSNLAGPVKVALAVLLLPLALILAPIIGIIFAITHLGQVFASLGNQAAIMRDTVGIQHAQMKIDADTNTIQMAQKVIANLETEKQGVLQKLKETHSASERLQLLHELSMLNTQISAQQQRQGIAATDRAKQLAAQQAAQDKLQEDQKNWFVRLLDDILGFFGMVFGAIGRFKDSVLQKASDVWNGIVNGAKNILGGLKDAIVNGLKGALNFFIGLINHVIDGFNHVPHFGAPLVPDIPYMAQGGYAQGWFVAGEKGPELIYSSGAQVYSNSQTKSMLGGQQQASYPIRPNVASVAMAASASNGVASGAASGHTTIVEIDSMELARIVQPATDKLARLKLGPRGRAA